MTHYCDLKVLLESYLSADELLLVDRAFEVAESAHSGQIRQSGEPYLFHPIAVAYILAQYHLDVETICACLLHDVLEDTSWTFSDLSGRFGLTIATLVDGVSKLRQISFPSRAHEQAENKIEGLKLRELLMNPKPSIKAEAHKRKTKQQALIDIERLG